ncbi:aspartyl-phosphate phosphatase Spo0E family protein [Bacillus sp. ISL-47]|uniref:aspartyl-phosphate phosphatase Spo0E family protein n=1 Tax=Bacillus sp. ISL-47 TaxID=2819130 RepID=UPI001BE8167A|nr:aspartyl-phosphate phosphatase Spo0E family protein [Bacillus sp. ISL-47]MBT2686675.1 aspartyl-phosphate phosphatase Spo0E family protein [Bacillus sp. ISL-47]MBT2707067.1 aspartyl-phosphate phosphatase Spo0E family protein [Pseudomonas sp. ISL-84]
MNIIQAIEEARQAMIESINSNGMADRQTLKLSQKLDELIFYAQKNATHKENTPSAFPK